MDAQGLVQAKELVEVLAERNLTCATAESCTGGGVGQAITAVSGSSVVFRGGVISYVNAVKRDVLGVDGSILSGAGPVSRPCAEQMASGARRLTGADIAVSVTGLAGPGGDGVRPAGYVWFGLATAEGVVAENVLFAGDRAAVRDAAVAHAVRMLLKAARVLPGRECGACAEK